MCQIVADRKALANTINFTLTLNFSLISKASSCSVPIVPVRPSFNLHNAQRYAENWQSKNRCEMVSWLELHKTHVAFAETPISCRKLFVSIFSCRALSKQNAILGLCEGNHIIWAYWNALCLLLINSQADLKHKVCVLLHAHLQPSASTGCGTGCWLIISHTGSRLWSFKDHFPSLMMPPSQRELLKLTGAIAAARLPLPPPNLKL